ncbi:hypothetical protein NRB20_58250 [Nocardia sp. RB20]|uniref:Uncharacterized protein n=1 Tax=Nocardia macrotermitis TaxID=2585198 RepID=A0A7K0DA99_9NOCA|nr:hypothetical protein [Nocardia macrotermitis]
MDFWVAIQNLLNQLDLGSSGFGSAGPVALRNIES